MNGPLPSTRVFLADIPALPADSKVRFLGCVKTYHVSTGHLVLEHNYPRVRKSGPKSKQHAPSITVDVNAVLEAVTWEELCVGAWVNVIGYVRQTSPALGDNVKEPAGSVFASVHVDAVVIFSAGVVDLGEYEQILSESLDAEKVIRMTGSV
ncbi:CST complex subunit Ten1 [Aspergillus unguis]